MKEKVTMTPQEAEKIAKEIQKNLQKSTDYTVHLLKRIIATL